MAGMSAFSQALRCRSGSCSIDNRLRPQLTFDFEQLGK
jgi:hypothetical protein